MIIYVVTDCESGWDCVKAVFKDLTDANKYCAERDGVEEWNEKNSTLIIHREVLQ